MASGARIASAAGDFLIRGAAGVLSPAGQSGRLSIAIFHRVLCEQDDIFPDEIDRASFDDICGWLAAWFNVLPLDAAVERLQQGTLPARALAITFDDGYADNHDVALPILRSHGLCATFFIATGHLDGGRMWNDTVIEAVRRCTALELDLNGLGLLGEQRWALNSPADRRVAIDALLPAVKYLPSATRQEVVDRIAERAGADLPRSLMMNSSQVRAMSSAGMQIGAHTVSHPILARVDDDVAMREMMGSKGQLEDILGHPVSLFAYPNGRPGVDYSERDVALARRVGFHAAVTTAAGAARAGDDVFQLPRFTPWDRGRMKFGVRMLRNLYDARSSR